MLVFEPFAVVNRLTTKYNSNTNNDFIQRNSFNIVANSAS